MAVSEHTIEAFESIPLCGEGDEWQDEWDSILAEAFSDTDVPSTREELTPVDALLTQDVSTTNQKLRTTAKTAKSKKKSKKHKEQANRALSCRLHTRPANPLPEIQPRPSVTIVQPHPPPPFPLFPVYNPWVWFQTPQGVGTFHCSCWKYHLYHQKKIMGVRIRGGQPSHDKKCPLKSGLPLSFHVPGK
jgi:hypothetical protein